MKRNKEDLFKNVKVFIENIELSNKEKTDLLKSVYFNKGNSEIKNITILLLKGYFLKVFLAFYRKLFHLEQNEKWFKICKELGDDFMDKKLIKLNIYKKKIIRLQDRKIVLELEKKEGLSFGDYMDILSSYYQSILSNQYNISSKNINGKIVVDCGSSHGEFGIFCMKLGAKKVYSFEPVTGTYKILVNNIKLNNLNSKVVPIKKALGDKNEKLRIYFNRAGDTGAYIPEDKVDKKQNVNTEIVEVIKLDDFIKDSEKIGFIKIDSEGYEEKVLKGASGIIKRDKPILSFSAYHKPTDKIKLPALIHSIRQDYKIKLLKRDEEDFYCE